MKYKLYSHVDHHPFCYGNLYIMPRASLNLQTLNNLTWLFMEGVRYFRHEAPYFAILPTNCKMNK